VTCDLVIEGGRITGIASFYDEINRVFMGGEDWRLGESLDALDDLLHGGYGALAALGGTARVLWRDMEVSRAALGREATLAFLRGRLASRRQFNGTPISGQIAALEAGGGTTYFDVVMAVFAEHAAVRLVAG
jgi:hypothetical protein